MAEIQLIVKDYPGIKNYKKFDIKDSFNDKRIAKSHLDGLCHIKKEPYNSDGMRARNCLAEIHYNKQYQYKYEQISKTEMRRIDRIIDETVIFKSGIPKYKCPTCGSWIKLVKRNIIFSNRMTNKWYCETCDKILYDDGEYIHVELYIKLCKNSKMFGIKGRAIWYGGKTIITLDKINAFWPEVESRLSINRNDYRKWNHSPMVLRKDLIIPMIDFNDTESSLYVESKHDLIDPKNPILIKKRTHYVDWENIRDVSPSTIEKINNKKISMDFRKFENYSLTDIKTKV